MNVIKKSLLIVLIIIWLPFLVWLFPAGYHPFNYYILELFLIACFIALHFFRNKISHIISYLVLVSMFFLETIYFFGTYKDLRVIKKGISSSWELIFNNDHISEENLFDIGMNGICAAAKYKELDTYRTFLFIDNNVEYRILDGVLIDENSGLKVTKHTDSISLEKINGEVFRVTKKGLLTPISDLENYYTHKRFSVMSSRKEVYAVVVFDHEYSASICGLYRFIYWFA